MDISIIYTKVNFENLSLSTSTFTCLFMASFYVISLYLWSKQKRFNRNDPSVIKRRFISVLITSILSLLIVCCLAQPEKSGKRKTRVSKQNYEYFPLNHFIGFRLDTFVTSVTSAMFLTLILFTGPIVQHVVSNYLFNLSLKLYDYTNDSAETTHITPQKTLNQLNTFENFIDYVKTEVASVVRGFKPDNMLNKLQDFCFLRNYIVSPFTEEFVFRSCMLPLLVHNVGVSTAVFVTPLFFGLAHLHHIIEGLMFNESFMHLLVQHLFQFTYTYIFGVYSSFLFLRTGNFFASFLSHSFCNLMGFPNIPELINEFTSKTRLVIVVCYVFGFATFFSLLTSMTEPRLFHNLTFQKYY